MLREYKIDPDYARKQIESNKHSSITTFYYLLMKKLKKPLYTRSNISPKVLNEQLPERPSISTTVVNNSNQNSEAKFSVLSSRSDALPQDDSIVNQIVEDSKQKSDTATADLIDDLSQTEKIELSDHLKFSQRPQPTTQLEKAFQNLGGNVTFESPEAIARIFSQELGEHDSKIIDESQLSFLEEKKPEMVIQSVEYEDMYGDFRDRENRKSAKKEKRTSRKHKKKHNRSQSMSKHYDRYDQSLMGKKSASQVRKKNLNITKQRTPLLTTNC